MSGIAGAARRTRLRAARNLNRLDAGAADGVPGRRQMPQFNLTDQELNDLADFLEWTTASRRRTGRRTRPAEHPDPDSPF